MGNIRGPSPAAGAVFWGEDGDGEWGRGCREETPSMVLMIFAASRSLWADRVRVFMEILVWETTWLMAAMICWVGVSIGGMEAHPFH